MMEAVQSIHNYRNILSASLQTNTSNLPGRNVFTQQDEDAKSTANNGLRQGKKVEAVSDWPVEHAFHHLK